MSTEYTFGSFSGAGKANGVIGGNDRHDTYGFSLNTTQNLSVSLSGLSADGDLRLFRAASINGTLNETEEIANSRNSADSSEFISQALTPGNYILDVEYYPTTGSTPYTLDLSTNNPSNQFNVGTLTSAQTFSGTVSNANASDLYAFRLNATSDLNLSLNGLSNDVDLRFGQDNNRNGTLEAAEVLGQSMRSFNSSESLNFNSDSQTALAAGDYLVEVNQFSGDSHYRLGMNATAVATPSANVDLTGRFLSVSAPDIRLTNQIGQAQVEVSNLGSRLANNLVHVNLYASTNGTYDSNDELLASQTLDLNLQSGQTQLANFTFGAPTGIAPGSYNLLARIDSTNAIAETNERNNGIAQSVSAPGTDVVLDWNATLLNAIQAVETAPPIAARNQAIVHAAIYDAVNAIERRYDYYEFNPNRLDRSVTNGAATIAAAAAAAFQTLVDLYPTQRAVFEAQLQRSLSEVVDEAAKQRGITIGQLVADDILQLRRNDGSSGAQGSYTPSTVPGSYQPTNADGAVALTRWGDVTPFAIPSAAAFVPAGPPVYGGYQYAVDLNEVQRVGGVDSTQRTNDQSDIAVFWAYDRPDTFRPPAQWNQIAETIALTKGTSILDNARLFAHLNLAQADAGIVAWETKYTYNQLRPITAIHQASNDGNAQTIGDPTWQSFLPTPPFPDYISGHAIFGAAAAGVLSAYFGSNTAFAVSSQEIPGTYRTYRSFQEAADENGRSRVYGGVHVEVSDLDGLTTGWAIANYVTLNFLG